MRILISIAKIVHVRAKLVGALMAHMPTMIVWKVMVAGKYSTSWEEMDYNLSSSSQVKKS